MSLIVTIGTQETARESNTVCLLDWNHVPQSFITKEEALMKTSLETCCIHTFVHHSYVCASFQTDVFPKKWHSFHTELATFLRVCNIPAFTKWFVAGPYQFVLSSTLTHFEKVICTEVSYLIVTPKWLIFHVTTFYGTLRDSGPCPGLPLLTLYFCLSLG